MFFPIVAKGQAGVRLMLRGDMTSAMTEAFTSALADAWDELG
jgi:7-keto-8-aminopelargonate synthetase-like enzyme